MNVFGCSRHIHIIHIWGFPLGVPLVIIHFNRIFSINHPFQGIPNLGPPHIIHIYVAKIPIAGETTDTCLVFILMFLMCVCSIHFFLSEKPNCCQFYTIFQVFGHSIIQGGAPQLAQLMNITPRTWFYGRYKYIYTIHGPWGLFRTTNRTGGPSFAARRFQGQICKSIVEPQSDADERLQAALSSGDTPDSWQFNTEG